MEWLGAIYGEGVDHVSSILIENGETYRITFLDIHSLHIAHDRTHLMERVVLPRLSLNRVQEEPTVEVFGKGQHVVLSTGAGAAQVPCFETVMNLAQPLEDSVDALASHIFDLV